MTLDELLTALGKANPDLVLPNGFNSPHSYRGYYDELAFEPASNVTVGSMISAAWSAHGETYTGYKGGEYTMGRHTECWLAFEGSSGGEEITPALLDSLLAAGSVPVPPGWTDEQEKTIRAAVRMIAKSPSPHPAMAGASLILTMRPLLTDLLGQVDHLTHRLTEPDASADQGDAARAGEPYLLDAYGRVIREGDIVGGTTSGRYQATISGPILKLGTGRVKIHVTSPGQGCDRPRTGDDKWISADRVFLVTHA
ncbi:hypothetical protein ABT358_02170 [Streptomyces sp. NPDC000341]|uniref:hypothetical protein n=1 Tax=Streptomyces sp. NPDC000341 TaxID=3156645 RepID=UPI003331072B